MTELTRRYFLKLAGSSVCAMAVLPFANEARRYAAKLPPGENLPPGQLDNPLAAPPSSLGRVATYRVPVYTEATRQSTLVRQTHRDDILPLYGQIVTRGGTHHVLWKSTTARMIGGAGSGYYDLPGVPFPTYFTPQAAAIHDAYWHNDFGHLRSHGCLNVPAPIARWFWRWTEPSAPYEVRRFDTPRGTDCTEIKVA
jgi:hypothetical protein